jgi:hypothetical protein
METGMMNGEWRIIEWEVDYSNQNEIPFVCVAHSYADVVQVVKVQIMMRTNIT